MGEYQGLHKQADHEVAWQRDHIAKLEYLLLAMTVFSIGFVIHVTLKSVYSWHSIIWMISVVLMVLSLGRGVVYSSAMMKSNHHLLSSFAAQISFFNQQQSLSDEIRSAQKAIDLKKELNQDLDAEEKALNVLETQRTKLNQLNAEEILRFSSQITSTSETARQAILQQLRMLCMGYVCLIAWHILTILPNSWVSKVHDKEHHQATVGSYSTPQLNNTSPHLVPTHKKPHEQKEKTSSLLPDLPPKIMIRWSKDEKNVP